MKWIDINKKLPDVNKPVFIYVQYKNGKGTTLRAVYIPEFHMEDDGESFKGDTDYNEENDLYYWPSGWYEWNEYEETHWRVADEVTHWCPMLEEPTLNNCVDDMVNSVDILFESDGSSAIDQQRQFLIDYERFQIGKQHLTLDSLLDDFLIDYNKD